MLAGGDVEQHGAGQALAASVRCALPPVSAPEQEAVNGAEGELTPPCPIPGARDGGIHTQAILVAEK